MKDKIILVLGFLCLVSAGLTFTYKQVYLNQKKRATAFENTISGLNEQLRTQRIQLNDSIKLWQAEAKTLSYSKKNLEAEYKTLLKASKTRSKDVSSFTGISTQVKAKDTVTCLVDSFGGMNIKVQDKWTNINVDINKQRQAVVEYSFKDSLTVFTIKKKHSILFGLIKWGSYEGVKVISHNPNAEISAVKNVEILK